MADVPGYLISEEDRIFLDALKDQLKADDRSTIVLVGSGVSRDCGYSSWDELAARLCEKVGSESKSASEADRDRGAMLMDQLDRAWTWYRDTYGANAEGHWLGDVSALLTEKKHGEFSDSHKSLVQINFSDILTTNYDDALLRAAEASGIRLEPTVYGSFDPFTVGHPPSGARCLYHLHGRLWDQQGEPTGQIVLVSPDYEVAYGDGRSGPVAALLNQFLPRNNVVLVGFGMQDPDLAELIRRSAVDEALRRLYEDRREPGGRRSSGPHWFRLIGLPGDAADEVASVRQARRNRSQSLFSLIHYRYSRGDGTHWGLHEVLRELAVSCPLEKAAVATAAQLSDASVPTAPVLPEPPNITAGLSRESGSRPTQVRDVHKFLTSIENVLRKGP